MCDCQSVPLSILALELPVTAAELERRLTGVVLIDELGRPAIDKPTAAALITEHRQRVVEQAERERQRRDQHKAELAKLPDVRDRVRRIKAQQQALVRAGVLDADADPLLVCAVGEYTNLDRAAARRDQLLAQERAKPGEAVIAGHTMLRPPSRREVRAREKGQQP